MTIAERPLVERPPEAGSTRADSIDRSNDIDLYRGLAALLVAAMHTRMITWIGIREFWRLHGLELTPEALLAYATLPLAFGSIGVPIFFVLSGYCIHRPHAARRARLGSFGLSPAEFYARRFFRIYPVLLGALALTFACDTASRGLVPESPLIGDTAVRAFLVNLLSLQGVAGGTYGSNIALWTLAIEVRCSSMCSIRCWRPRWRDWETGPPSCGSRGSPRSPTTPSNVTAFAGSLPIGRAGSSAR
jgi:peptidoglycan/LPS O-acetylase OafA/YrhL